MGLEEEWEKEIRKQVSELDNSYPAGLPPQEVLWESIQSSRRRSRVRKLQIRWSMAATVALLVMAGLGVLQPWAPGREQAHDVELLSLLSDIPGGSSAYDYIYQVCNTRSGQCKSEQFLALQSELRQSSLQLEEIEKQISLFGPDQHLVNARTRVEKHQHRIIKTIVQSI